MRFFAKGCTSSHIAILHLTPQNSNAKVVEMDKETRILVKEVLRDMTQESFAKIAEVSGATISLWLSGKRNMHPLIERHIRQVAEELLRKAS